MLEHAPLVVAGLAVTLSMVTEWRTGLIPNAVTYPAFVCALVLRSLQGWGEPMTGGAVGALIAMVVTVVFALSARSRVGSGAAKLLIAVGTALALPAAFGLVLGFLALLGLFAVLRKTPQVPGSPLIGAFAAASVGVVTLLQG